MKDILDEESRQTLIKYRMERAYDSMKEAQLMAEKSFYNAAINRLYYACYYAAVALLLTNDIPAQTHSGVKTMLGLHFIAKGKLSSSAGKTLSVLFSQRHSSDYDAFVYCDKDMVDEYYPKAEAFIEEVKGLIENPKDKSKQNIQV